jgi:predicted lipid-binding transport protein (Tim44 family)
MLGGLAAGLGLAWLASSLGLGGLGSVIGQVLMFGLLALAIMLVVGWVMRSRKAAQSSQTAKSPFAFQGASPGNEAQSPSTYRPENVGNDASARPWERSSTAFESLKPAPQASGSGIGSALGGSQTWGIPADFDTEGFLISAKANFVALQAAWDKADIGTLRVMMTDSMLKEIQAQLAEREAHTGGPGNLTEVLMIEAQLLGIEDLGGEYMVSVEFSGMIREEPSAGPNPFREVWNMTKPKSGGSGWLVAGVQALQ